MEQPVFYLAKRDKMCEKGKIMNVSVFLYHKTQCNC